MLEEGKRKSCFDLLRRDLRLLDDGVLLGVIVVLLGVALPVGVLLELRLVTVDQPPAPSESLVFVLSESFAVVVATSLQLAFLCSTGFFACSSESDDEEVSSAEEEMNSYMFAISASSHSDESSVTLTISPSSSIIRSASSALTFSGSSSS